MTTTRKEIIINKYLEFQNNINSIVPIDVFPSLEEIDVVDLLMFFNFTFGCVNEYENIITELISFNNVEIKPQEMEKVMPVIIQFIDEFKLLQKSF